MERRRFGKESLNVAFKFDLVLEPCSAVARSPADDLVNFLFRAVLAFGLLNIHRGNARKFHSVDSVLRPSPLLLSIETRLAGPPGR
jgi:hypothetical protein